MMVIVAASVYILFVAVCGTVGVLHRSRVGWWRGVAGIFLGSFGVSVAVALYFIGTRVFLIVEISFNLNFR